MKIFELISLVKKSLHNPKKYGYKICILLIFIGVPSISLANLPHCDSYFQNGIQAHGVDSYIRFDYNAQLVNGSGPYLLGNSVINNKFSIKKSCGTQMCTKLGSIAEDMTPGVLLETAATNEFIIPADRKATVGANNVLHYGKIVVGERSVATFKQQTAPYLITQLEVGYKSKLRLPAGEYWVSRLRLEVEGRIDVIGEGQVTLYVVDSLWVPFNFKINDNTKNSAKMAIYTFSDANYYTGSKTYAFIRSEGEIILNHRSTIVGGILGKYINLQTESQVVFDPAGARGVQFARYCVPYEFPLDPDQPIFILDQYDDITTLDHIIFTGTIVDSGEHASGLKETSININGEWVPITLTGDNFSINAPLELGDNLFTFLIIDNALNELFLSYYVSRVLPGEDN
jgi:hypothetical protein